MAPFSVLALSSQSVHSHDRFGYRAGAALRLTTLWPKTVRWLAPLALATLAITGTACSRTGGRGTLDPEAEGTFVSATERSLELTQREIDRLAIADPESLRTAALTHVDDPDTTIHSAALYALSLSVDARDRAARDTLQRFLTSLDDVERLRASVGLIGVGDKAAVPVLIDLIGSSAVLPGGDPPLAVWRVARGTLMVNTGEDFGLRRADSVEAARATRPSWTAWWSTYGADLQWNPELEKFSR